MFLQTIYFIIDTSSDNDSDGNNVTLLANLQNEIKINDRLNQVIMNNRSLKRYINELTTENTGLYDLLYDMELQINNLNQYMRRSSIEIRNVSERINQCNLEQYVLKVFESIGGNLVSYDLVTVHHVGKFMEGKNRNVIVKFLNRKNAFICLRNAKRLASSDIPDYKKLYFIENLCPSSKRIFNYLYKLKKESKISNVWTFNGSVFFKKLNTDDEYCQKVEHFNEIQYFLDIYIYIYIYTYIYIYIYIYIHG